VETTILVQVLQVIVEELEVKHVNPIHAAQATNVALNLVQAQATNAFILMLEAIRGVAQLFLQKLLVLMDMIMIVMEKQIVQILTVLGKLDQGE
jgi:hypothetical protein